VPLYLHLTSFTDSTRGWAGSPRQDRGSVFFGFKRFAPSPWLVVLLVCRAASAPRSRHLPQNSRFQIKGFSFLLGPNARCVFHPSLFSRTRILYHLPLPLYICIDIISFNVGVFIPRYIEFFFNRPFTGRFLLLPDRRSTRGFSLYNVCSPPFRPLISVMKVCLWLFICVPPPPEFSTPSRIFLSRGSTPFFLFRPVQSCRWPWCARS